MKKKILLLFVIMLSFLVYSIGAANAADFVMTNGTVSISDTPSNGTLMVAAYDESNAFLGCKIYENEGNYAKDLDMTKAHSVKTFLWDMNTLKPLSSGNDVLVVYFSATNTTENLAKNIHAKTGGDLVEILPVQPYTSADLNYNDSNSRANTEINTDARPEILTRITDINQYNTIIIGYPIWWGDVPPVVRTFLDSYDLSGKTVMPFCTSGGSGISGSMAKIRELCTNSTVTAGLDRRGDTDIDNWLTDTGFYTRPTPTPVPTPTPLPEQIDNLVLINEGTFNMGSPTDEPERSSDETQHKVKVDSFYISKTEVSQAEYQAVMNSNPSENKGNNLPVTNITWYDAIRYCNALSEKKGLHPAIPFTAQPLLGIKTQTATVCLPKPNGSMPQE